MAKRTTSPEPIGEPQVDPATAIRLVKGQIEKGRLLLTPPSTDEGEYDKWQLLTSNLLEKAFGRNSPNVNKVKDAAGVFMVPMNADAAWWNRHRRNSLGSQLSLMEGLVELLETELELQGGAPPNSALHTQPTDIFLVHGHDEAALHEIARFLEKLDQHVTILRDQPNKGRTIIEKFEDYSNCGFAVVLLTPDDKGGTADATIDQMKLRARQNVILELGYFLGRIGRNRVCALYIEGTEIPSDYSGVLYLPLDKEGGWRLRLAKELVSAGFKLDMNKAL